MMIHKKEGYLRMAIESQVATFQKLFSRKLNGKHLLESKDLFLEVFDRPGNTPVPDHWFVIPKWWSIAKTLPDATNLMARAVGVDQRSFLEGYPIDELKQYENTENALQVFADKQGGDFLVIPLQLGYYHQGESPESLHERMPVNEFGCPLYLALAAIASHKGRLNGSDGQIGINCPGNKPLNGYGEPKIPCLNSFQGRVRCLMNKIGQSNPNYGSATGFNFIRAF